MAEHIAERDESILRRKAEQGRISEDEAEIPAQSLELPLDNFPELSEEKEGDKVVLVVSGTVKGLGKDSVTVDLARASVVHGKIHGVFSGKGANAKTKRFWRTDEFARPRESHGYLDEALALGGALKRPNAAGEKKGRREGYAK